MVAEHLEADNKSLSLKTAIYLLDRGLWPVAIHSIHAPVSSPGKQPIKRGWGLKRPSEETLREIWRDYPHGEPNVGLKLGKDSGVVDIEIDDREVGESTLLEMFGGEVIETMGWESRLGPHYLFQWDDRLGEIAAKHGYSGYIRGVFPGVEVRLGWARPGGQFQSVVPPSLNIETGTPRTWNPFTEIARLPDSFFDYVDSYLARVRSHPERETIPLFARATDPAAPLDRARAYLAKIEPAVSRQGGHKKTFWAACQVGPGFDLPKDQALGLLREWNQSCQPPWSEKELLHKVEDAYKKESRRGWLLEENSTGDNQSQGGGGGQAHPAGIRSEPWKPPRVHEPLPAVPFPLDALPHSLSQLCREGAEAVQCPVDYLGAAALALAGGVIGLSVNLKVKADYPVSPNLYMAIVGPPGTKKSPVVLILSRPLYDLDQELRDIYKAERSQYEDLRREYESQSKKGGAIGPPPVAPVHAQLTMDDATREALALIHSENPRGIILIKDELFGWVASFNAYKPGGRGDDRQFWLSVNTGSLVKVNRKGNREQIIVPRPCVAVVGGLTPARLPGFRGLPDDGWLDRILFSYPEPIPVQDWSEAEIPRDLLEDWSFALRRLWDRKMVLDDQGRLRPHYVSMTGPAKALWREWVNAHRRETTHRDFPRSLLGPWSKMEGFAARLALIVSQLRRAYDPADDLTIDRDLEPLSIWDARKLIEYFKMHFRRARIELARRYEAPDDAEALLNWFRHSGRARFSERDARKNFQGRFGRNPIALAEALEWLFAQDCIRPLPGQPQLNGRPHSPEYEVNPVLLSDDSDDPSESPDPEERSQAEDT